MIGAISKRTGAAAVALACLLLSTAPPALAQQGAGSDGHPFDGEWSLVMDLSTAPGGATLTFGDTTISPYNYAIHVANERFHVKEDGSFKWSQSDAGSTSYSLVHHDSTGTTQGRGSRTMDLRAAGKVEVPRPAGGEPRDENRSLTVEVTWVHGNGYYSVAGPTVTATIALSNQATVVAGVEPWSLKPKRVTNEELAPDVIRQTTTYEATRVTNYVVADAGSVPTTQRIEIKHVRYLNLVPRG